MAKTLTFPDMFHSKGYYYVIDEGCKYNIRPFHVKTTPKSLFTRQFNFFHIGQIGVVGVDRHGTWYLSSVAFPLLRYIYILSK